MKITPIQVKELAALIGARAYLNLLQAAVDIKRDATIGTRLIISASEEILTTAEIADPPCSACEERHREEAEAEDGARNAAEIAGLLAITDAKTI